jgi:hypothetical protein
LRHPLCLGRSPGRSAEIRDDALDRVSRRVELRISEELPFGGVAHTAARTSVVPSNTGATRLYESLGFRLTGEQDDGELVMTLEL